MEFKQITINNKCSSLIMRALSKGVYKKEAFSIMDFLSETPQFYPLLPIYNGILRSCTKTHNLIQATKCLDLMEKKMIGKNEVTYTALLQVCNVHIKTYITLNNTNFVAKFWKQQKVF